MSKENKNALGDCYELAFGYFVNHYHEDLLLMHGDIIWQGEVIKHAWVELHDEVIDLTQKVSTINKEKYYIVGKIDKDSVKQYQYADIAKLAITHMHYGPYPDENKNKE